MTGLLGDLEFWRLLPGLLWTVAGLVLAVKLWPLLADILRSRKFTIKVGSAELTVQEASQDFRQSISDLQTRLAALEDRLAETGAARPAAAGPADGAGAAAPAPEGPRAQPKPLRILWVDDAPQNHATGVATLRDNGFEIVEVPSTEAALTAIGTQDFDVILSDIGRPEGRDAGVALLERLRGQGVATPFGFFTTARALERHAARLDGRELFVATNSFVELLSALKRLSRTEAG